MLFILYVTFVAASILGLFCCTACIITSVKTQFSDHVKIRYISKLISDIASVLPKLLKYFNGTTTSLSLFIVVLLPSSFSSVFNVFPVIPLLYLNDAEFVVG